MRPIAANNLPEKLLTFAGKETYLYHALRALKNYCLILNTDLQFSSMKVFATNKNLYRWCKKGIVVVDIIAPLL